MSLQLKRSIVPDATREKTVAILQGCLVDLLDLALQGKQAHWNLLGTRFRSVHLQLDEIIDAARMASDEVAERIVTLGRAADGRAAEIAGSTRLEKFPGGLLSVDDAISHYSDRLAKTIEGLRSGISQLGELDPISEDLLIGISAGLEKHLWMMQAQEV
ncbi:MAG: DNA starvation/stationary phase protection protein [Acidobacteria bacterium]|nr:MAG: DNA starvation/stationary phase protection protein [Acidobacteriota bacterium]REK07831.1 MAG: DNA starvation/stationary phase protection protein [Acidobacteriota bacterium]